MQVGLSWGDCLCKSGAKTASGSCLWCSQGGLGGRGKFMRLIGKTIAVLNENGTGGRRGTAPVLGSGAFLYAYGTQANVNQVGLLY